MKHLKMKYPRCIKITINCPMQNYSSISIHRCMICEYFNGIEIDDVKIEGKVDCAGER
jgi:hypothetical protein